MEKCNTHITWQNRVFATHALYARIDRISASNQAMHLGHWLSDIVVVPVTILFDRSSRFTLPANFSSFMMII
jgi:hypothetical protein